VNVQKQKSSQNIYLFPKHSQKNDTEAVTGESLFKMLHFVPCLTPFFFLEGGTTTVVHFFTVFFLRVQKKESQTGLE